MEKITNKIDALEYATQLEEAYLKNPAVDPQEARSKAAQNADKLDALDDCQDGIIDFARIREKRDFDTQMKLGGIIGNVPRVKLGVFSPTQLDEVKKELGVEPLEESLLLTSDAPLFISADHQDSQTSPRTFPGALRYNQEVKNEDGVLTGYRAIYVGLESLPEPRMFKP